LITLRKSQDRGHAEHGWLQSKHTFSFARYYDPQHMGFRALRVINEDHIAGGGGFGTHPHRDMEIITYVIQGALEHKDSMGNTTVIYPGEVQRMSAGTGITHSEFNHESNRETHLLQIWILPQENGIQPSYGQKSFAKEIQEQEKVLVVSKDGREGSISIFQDVDIYLSRAPKGARAEYPLRPGRAFWLQVVQGSLIAGGVELSPGDGLAVEAESSLRIESRECEYLLFDLP